MAIVDVPIAYNEDLERVRRIVDHVGTLMDNDPAYDGILFGTPTYAGVESVSGDAVFVRVTCKAAPDQQMSAARAVREQLKLAFDKEGVRVPILQRQNLPGSTATRRCARWNPAARLRAPERSSRADPPGRERPGARSGGSSDRLTACAVSSPDRLDTSAGRLRARAARGRSRGARAGTAPRAARGPIVVRQGRGRRR